MAREFDAKYWAYLAKVPILFLAFVLGCSNAPIDRIWGHYVGVRLTPVEIAPDTCRIDMSVTNLRDRGAVRPGFEIQIISVDEWDEIPHHTRVAPTHNPRPYRSGSLYAYGQKVKVLFDEIPAGQTAAKSLKTLNMSCSNLGLYAFWMACHVGFGGELTWKLARVGCEALLTPWGQPYFDVGTWEAIAHRFRVALVECPRSDPVCNGPVDADRIPLGHLESLPVMAGPGAHGHEQDSRLKIDLAIERILVDEKVCELRMLVTNMTEGLTLSPVLEFEIGLIPDHFPDKPQSWTRSVSFGQLEPYHSDERVVGAIDVPCWGLDALTFRRVCHQDGADCRTLHRLPGKPFLDQASGEYLSVSLRNTPMYRRP
jgi:hypothetical protein